MSEGTSQGLFVVVAIVIFGIFVGLTYTLFGSEGLTNDLKGIFDSTIERVNNSNSLLNVTSKDWKPHAIKSVDSAEQIENGYIITSSGTPAVGLKLGSTYINHGQEYELSFDLTKLSGNINQIGGHIFTLEGTTYDVFIDDVLVGHDFKVNTYPYAFDNQTHNIKVKFVGTHDAVKDTYGNIDNSIYIQPNRYSGKEPSIVNYAVPYSAKIENIVLKEI